MSKGENMVERCASAISISDGYTGLWAMPREKRSLYIRRARAVIEALMNPTPEMLAAVQREITGYPRPEAVIATWQVLLRTALSQPNDEGEGK